MGKLFASLYLYIIVSLFLVSGVIEQLWPYEDTQQHIALDQEFGKSLWLLSQTEEGLEKLQQALESNDPEQTDFIAWEINREYGMPPGKRRTLEYASDFFIFSPKERNNIFKDYVQYWTDNPHIQGQPGANSGCERFLGYQTQKYGLNVAYLDRGLYGGMRTELEPLGIWHCHNLRQIEQYLHRNF